MAPMQYVIVRPLSTVGYMSELSTVDSGLTNLIRQWSN